ncbi:von Willebrand factor A domain-containing protein 5A, partial [Orchesella cincta]
LQADLGGTEILRPLKEIYGQPGIAGYLRQIFVLTDGAVFNTEGVIGITQINAHKVRVFSLGIGDAASHHPGGGSVGQVEMHGYIKFPPEPPACHHLVEGIAKAGGGTSAFVTQNKSIDKKVLNQLKNGLQPSLTEKTLLGYNKTVGIYTSNHISKQTVVYNGSQLLAFGIFRSECSTAVTFKALSPDGPLTIRVEHSSDNDVGTTGMLHQLAAVKLVRELELEIGALRFQDLDDVSGKEEEKKKEIEEIACKNGLTSKYTSYVAIDAKDNKPLMRNWPMAMETRYVRSQIAQGSVYQQQQSGLPCSSGFPQSGTFIPYIPGRNHTKSGRVHSYSNNANSYLSLEMPPQRLPMPESYIRWPPGESPPHLPPRRAKCSSSHGVFDYKLSETLGISLEKLNEDAKTHGLPEKVFATAIAIAFFTNKLATEKDVWELIVVKAKKWLSKNISDVTDIDSIISKVASRFVL